MFDSAKHTVVFDEYSWVNQRLKKNGSGSQNKPRWFRTLMGTEIGNYWWLWVVDGGVSVLS